MTCGEVKKALKEQREVGEELTGEASFHLRTCSSCRKLWASAEVAERFSCRLLQDFGAHNRAESADIPANFFFSRLVARIDGERPRVNFWEAVVISTKGWLIGFSAIAALFLLASFWALHLTNYRPGAEGNDFSVEALAASGSESSLFGGYGHDPATQSGLEESNDERKQ